MVRKISLCSFILFILISFSQSGITDGLVGYWNFDETTGVSAMDASGNNNTLDIKGESWQSGKVGGALMFDGSSTFGERADAQLIGAFPSKKTGQTEDFTLSAWIKLNSLNERRPIVGKQGSGIRGFMFMVERSNVLGLEMFKDGSSRSAVSSTVTLEANKWYQVMSTYDFKTDGTSQMVLFVDGKQVGISQTAVGPPNANNLALEIGHYFWLADGSHAWYWDGLIDEVRIYNRVLTAEEIQEVFLYDKTVGTIRTPGVNPKKNGAFLSTYPNPFVRSIKLTFPEHEIINLRILDSKFRLVRRLVGEKGVSWDGMNALGLRVPNGIYFAQVSFGGKKITKKILKLE